MVYDSYANMTGIEKPWGQASNVVATFSTPLGITPYGTRKWNAPAADYRQYLTPKMPGCWTGKPITVLFLKVDKCGGNKCIKTLPIGNDIFARGTGEEKIF